MGKAKGEAFPPDLNWRQFVSIPLCGRPWTFKPYFTTCSYYLLLAGSEHGSFLFDVTDGVIVRTQLTFRVQSWPPTLTITSRGPLQVFPGVDQPISSRVLRATTDDVIQSRTIIYTVTSGPKLGQLCVRNAASGSDPVDLTSFTQHEVSEGMIVYRATTNATDSPWTGLSDSILLQVIDVKSSYDIVCHLEVKYWPLCLSVRLSAVLSVICNVCIVAKQYVVGGRRWYCWNLAMTNSYRLSIVTKSLFAAVLPQFFLSTAAITHVS